MSEPAAILATFSDLKLIKTRKVAQLVFEVPIESVRSATEALGWPTGEQWCGIARVTKSAGGTDLVHSGSGQPRERLAEVPPAKPKERSPSQRAAYLCTKPKFWAYLNNLQRAHVVSDVTTADFVMKKLLNLTSKTQLDNVDDLAEDYLGLEGRFKEWAYGVAA